MMVLFGWSRCQISLFLKFWLNFSFWNLWHEISQKSRACMENITLLPSKFAQIIIYVNMLRYETVVIKWKYVHCELGAEIFHFNLVFCCREKRKSPLNMVEKSYKNWPLWFFLIFLYFWTIKGTWKKIFYAKYRHHITRFMIFWQWQLRPSLMIKRRKKINAEKHAFSCYYPQKFIWFFGSYGVICFENCSKLNFMI